MIGQRPWTRLTPKPHRPDTRHLCAPARRGSDHGVTHLDSPEDLARAKQGWPQQMARCADRKNRAFYLFIACASGVSRNRKGGCAVDESPQLLHLQGVS